MSATPCSKTRAFMEGGSPNQFEWILEQYDVCLRLKAESKSQRPENVIKLDKWYQNELPKKIKSRSKEGIHLTHEDLVQTMKWKLARGKFRPNLTNLVQMNTPRVAMVETKKAFKKLAKTGDLNGSVQSLSNLKGVGPAMASAILAAGAPDVAPYMADEILLALPDTDGLDYTMKEYMRLVEHVNTCVKRLNDMGGDFTPHKASQGVWTYYIANDLKPEILDDLPEKITKKTPAPLVEEETEEKKTEEEEKKKEEESKNGETEEEKKKNGNGTSAAAEETNGATSAEDNSNMSSALDEESCSSTAVEPEFPVEEEKTVKETVEEKETNGKSKEVVEEEKKTTTNGTNADESKKNGNGKIAASVEPIIPSKQVESDESSSPIEEEEDTSDSTKENVASSPSSLKRPVADDNEDANDATETVVSEEPAAKKLKPEEVSPAPLTA